MGVLAPDIVFGISLAISGGFAFYVSGAVCFFSAQPGWALRAGGDWLSACLLYLPLAGMFGFFVLHQLPFLWPNLLLWALATALGLFLLAARLRGTAMISGVFRRME